MTMKKTELHFNRQRESAPPVSDVEIDQFIADSVVPRFDGFTRIDSIEYLGGKRTQSLILVFLCKIPIRLKLSYIRSEYCRLFNQKSVLLVEYMVYADF